MRTCRVLILSLMVVSAGHAASPFSLLHSFDGVEGKRPYGSVTWYQGQLYGTTIYGKSGLGGSVYRLSPDGKTFMVLRTFEDSTGGHQPYNGLTVLDGMLYGVTRYRGGGRGALFRIRPDGKDFSVVHSFAGGKADGAVPISAPVVHRGKLYGLTHKGGENGAGGLYGYDPAAGKTTFLKSLPSPGGKPFGTLTSVGAWLYGMASDHRDKTHAGTIFRYCPDDGRFEVVHRFAGGAKGGYPYDSLTWDGGEWLYGTTLGFYPPTGKTEGLDDEGVVFRLHIPDHAYEVIHDFSSQTGDGAKPNSSMLVGPDGFLYGIAHGNEVWGGSEYGTLFRMQPDGGEFTVLHVFDSMERGDTPMRSIVWHDGVLYGTAAFGGKVNPGESGYDARGYGTVWKYVLPPAPPASDSLTTSDDVWWVAGGGVAAVVMIGIGIVFRKKATGR